MHVKWARKCTFCAKTSPSDSHTVESKLLQGLHFESVLGKFNEDRSYMVPRGPFDDLLFNVTPYTVVSISLTSDAQRSAKNGALQDEGVEEKEWDLDTSIKNKKYQHMC